jgi:hypothetical protein
MKLSRVSHNKKDLIVIALVASLLPVWRSGGHSGLNFWQFTLNHTVLGAPLEYVPEEDYVVELSREIQGR